MELPVMLTVRQTAERAGVSEYAVRRWVADGQVHCVRSGNKIYISWASMVQFLTGEHAHAAVIG